MNIEIIFQIWRTLEYFFSRFGFRAFKRLRNVQDAIVEFPLNQIQNVEEVLNNGSC